MHGMQTHPNKIPSPIPPTHLCLLQLQAEFVRQTLTHEQEQYQTLQMEHEQLLRKQEVLQEELQMALNNYQPKAVIDAGGWAGTCHW